MKARGEGFFAAFDTAAYQPRGVLLGQATDDSCVAACVRMLLIDRFPERADDYRFSESFIRDVCRTGRDGSLVAGIPAVLQEMGIVTPYVFRADLTIDDLREAVAFGFAIASVRTSAPREVHVVIVEEVTEEDVVVRDPLPQSASAAYRVPLSLFLERWLSVKTQLGSAVVVIE
ncbi:MAG: cysteine peptidase family C39 domain-containing protein [Blastocatellia bacterium]